MNSYNLHHQDPTLFKKIEQMKEQNFKAQAREATYNWRNHVPVYGWVQINYPTGIQKPLREKYKEEELQKQIEKEEKEQKLKEEEEKKIEENEINKNNPNQIPLKRNKARVNPENVNEGVLKDIENLVPIDYSENFLKNYPKNDFAFLKNQFRNYEISKRKFDIDEKVPFSYNKLISEGENKYLYQLGIKNASTYLSTMDYDKKCQFVDMNLLIDEKYCTMFPKSSMLGPKPDKNFENPVKKIGDISFEEDKTEIETVKNLSRLPPENITEEWVKDNLSGNVTKINFENCYWLSKDLISKLGRLDPNLKKISLRNLDLSNYMVENILQYAKEVEELDISNCTGLTKGLLEIIAEKGKNLTHLNIFNIPDAVDDFGLNIIGKKLINLKSINLGRNYKVTDKGIDGLLCHKQNDRIVKEEESYYPPLLKLEKIEITNIPNLTNESAKIILQNTKDTLTDLTLNFLPKITAEGLELLKECKKLKNLEIMGLSPKANTADLIQGLSNLFTLNLSGCTLINDSNVIGILNSNPNLRILRLSNCTELTNNLIDQMLEKPNNLLLMELNRKTKISDAKIEEFVEKKKPNMRIIRATNMVWSKKNLGTTVPYPSDNYVKPNIKGVKKAAPKKNDDKSPEVQLMKLREEIKPKMIFEFFKPAEKAKKKGGKKK
jgi:hypothetical protein